MVHYIHLFSVCNKFLSRRKEVVEYLYHVVPGIKFITLDLDDNVFVLAVRSIGKVENLILSLIREKGLPIKLLRSVEVEEPRSLYKDFRYQI